MDQGDSLMHLVCVRGPRGEHHPHYSCRCTRILQVWRWGVRIRAHPSGQMLGGQELGNGHSPGYQYFKHNYARSQQLLHAMSGRPVALGGGRGASKARLAGHWYSGYCASGFCMRRPGEGGWVLFCLLPRFRSILCMISTSPAFYSLF
jgi:hypothetical protein